MGCVAAPMSLSELPRRGLRVAIFGSTEFHGAESRRLCELLGAKLAQRCGTQLVLLTGGNAVVHEVLARSFLEAAELKVERRFGAGSRRFPWFSEEFGVFRGLKRMVHSLFCA